MKLIAMTSFVLQQTKESTENMKLGGVSEALHKINNYARFLKQPLKLEMFVPCMEIHDDSVPFPKMKTIILEPLEMCCSGSECGCMGMPINVSSQEEIDEYYIAEEKVLFKGLDLPPKDEIIKLIKGETIELLADDKTELTDSAIKQLGL